MCTVDRGVGEGGASPSRTNVSRDKRLACSPSPYASRMLPRKSDSRLLSHVTSPGLSRFGRRPGESRLLSCGRAALDNEDLLAVTADETTDEYRAFC
eukprot:4529638-Prymnesium_polylepis.2